MKALMKSGRIVAAVVIFFAFPSFAQVPPQKEKVIAGAERAFEKVTKTVAMPAPGCAVGVSLNGESVFEKAFGMAEMEHSVANTPQTIFESGSVAKQFTAAALVLLQQDGKLDLDDQVRKYIPELPDYGSPLTIRQMLNHTAGLRDWGSVMALTGVGRGDRVITQDVALDVIARQKSLDFKPGAEFSYTNSGYNLAAIIVERVSKQKFGDFLAERLFKPLGMTNTSVRDDYRRIVPHRAQAYSRDGSNAPWRLNMPFMNVYGNGGMLTTVGDWLKWNAMLDARTFNAKLVDELETRGVLNDKQKIGYALGLNVGDYKGLKDISHGGSTAGYQTFLARYPDQKLSLAVLCNGTSPSASGIAANVTDEILALSAGRPTPPDGVQVSEEQLKKLTGLYRDEKTSFPARLVVDGGSLRFNGSPLRPQGDGTFVMQSTIRLAFTFDKDGTPVSIEGRDAGEYKKFVRETEWTPAAAELAAFTGDWYSEEADAKFTFAVDGNKAFLKQRPASNFPLQPLYKDYFRYQGYIIWVTRAAAGKIDKLHVGGSRMRDMPFTRILK